MADADVSFVADDISHLVFRVTNLFPGVEVELESVLKGLMQMHLFLDGAGAKQEQNEVKKWVEDLKGVGQDVEEVIDDFTLKTVVKKMGFRKSLHFSWQDPQSFHKLRMKLKQIQSNIHDISRKRRSLGIGYIDEGSPYRPSSSHIDRQDLVGFEKYIEEIEKQLTTEGTRRVISIVGQIGTGKKALAGKIYNSDAVKNQFPCRAWVIVSQLYNTEEILQEIAAQVEFYKNKPDTRDVREEGILVRNLCEFLETRKYFIVMADMWSIKVWDKLEAAFPNSNNGSMILLTTCDKEAVTEHANGEDQIIQQKKLRLLSEDESWKLFTSKVPITSEFEQLAREVVRNCEGIPLAIVRFRDLLSKKDARFEGEWLRALRLFRDRRRLWMYIMAMNEDNDLPLYLKRCLFYVVYFPENYEIPARRLIALWVAEGLVEDTQYGLSPEDVAETYLTVLINRNLIEVKKQKFDGEVKICRLPHAQRQLWLSKAKEANFLLSPRKRNSMSLSSNSSLTSISSSTSSSSSSSSSSSKAMILRLVDHLDENDASYTHLHGNDTNSFQPYKYLYSFLSFDKREGSKPGEEMENFLLRGITNRCFQKLRVLDLEGVFKPRLDRVLRKLIHLRYLGLRWTFLDTLPPSIGNLKYLQTLDLKHTYINNLPSSIWKMQHLRHLYLNNSEFEAIRGCNLPELQTLWGVLVDEESQVKGALDKSTDLRKLGLACRSMSEDSQQEALSEWVGKLKYLRSLRLKSSDDLGLPSDLKLKSLSGLKDLSNLYMFGKLQNLFGVHEFPPSVTRLTLSASKLRTDPMQTLEKLPNLRILELYSGSYTGRRMVCSSEGFRQLRQLRLWKLEKLEEWTVEKEAMPSIREIEIRFCSKLKMLPEGLQHVNTLQKLKLTGMPGDFTAKFKESPLSYSVDVEDVDSS
ncbi:hypothetical protein HHK36_022359 [Tetracentron sinense]|uniref:Uncharacterized protein n=1 Tax=Tetracentron sinense TaxID=13715 RepID=A0A834YMT0_TETSI|nr:hypothetical protein HHK36_022359 [Tetracentron sinense]